MIYPYGWPYEYPKLQSLDKKILKIFLNRNERFLFMYKAYYVHVGRSPDAKAILAIGQGQWHKNNMLGKVRKVQTSPARQLDAPLASL